MAAATPHGWCWFLNVRWESMHDTQGRLKWNAPVFDSNALCACVTKLLSQLRQHEQSATFWCCKDLIFPPYTLMPVQHNFQHLLNWTQLILQEVADCCSWTSFQQLTCCFFRPRCENELLTTPNWLHRFPMGTKWVWVLQVSVAHLAKLDSSRHKAYGVEIHIIKKKKYEIWKLEESSSLECLKYFGLKICLFAESRCPWLASFSPKMVGEDTRGAATFPFLEGKISPPSINKGRQFSFHALNGNSTLSR